MLLKYIVNPNGLSAIIKIIIMAKVSLSIKSLNSSDFNEDKVQKLESHDIPFEINDEKITAKILINDDKLSATLNSAFSFNEPLKKHQLELKFNYLNLHEFNPEFGGGKAVFSGDLNLFFVGNHFDDIRGNVIFKDIAFENAFKIFSYNPNKLITSISYTNFLNLIS